VAGSQAPLAEQFRDEIRAQMAAGASDDEILDYFVERYGQQVLLTPPSSGAGWLVWLLPLLVAGGAVVGFLWVLPRWRAAAAADGPEAAAADGPDASPPVQDLGGGSRPDGDGTRPSPARRAAVVVAVVGAVVALGAVLVRGTTERADAPTTGAPVSARDAMARCRSTAMGDPAAAVDCYDSVLEADPENVEALSYRGWAHLRSDDPAAAQADLDRAVELDPGYPDVRVFRAIAASRVEDFEAASAELSAFFASEPEGFAVSIVESEGLERTIFFALLDDGTAACWKRAADQGGGEIDQEFLDALGGCLDGVLAVDPTSRDARLSRAIAEVGPGGGDPALASTLLAGLLAEDPDDADAMGLQVLVQLGAGELDAAEQSLDRLAGLPRAPSAFLVGDVDTLRAALDAARDPDGGPQDADDPGGS
jgi:cytochrome c-type biogenesis protein CcmH